MQTNESNVVSLASARADRTAEPEPCALELSEYAVGFIDALLYTEGTPYGTVTDEQFLSKMRVLDRYIREQRGEHPPAVTDFEEQLRLQFEEERS